LKDLQQAKKIDLSSIQEDIKEDIFLQIAKIKDIEKNQVDENKNLIIDLYFDSLDMAEIKSYIQSKYPKSSNPPITDLKTV
jgi:acyl carrier protein